jgi:hypothetical protein
VEQVAAWLRVVAIVSAGGGEGRSAAVQQALIDPRTQKNIYINVNMPTTTAISSGGGQKKRATNTKAKSKPKPATKKSAKSAKSATTGYTKTARKDTKGRIIYKNGKGEDKVRCRSVSGANIGKLTWRKPSNKATAKPTKSKRQKGGALYEN